MCPHFTTTQLVNSCLAMSLHLFLLFWFPCVSALFNVQFNWGVTDSSVKAKITESVQFKFFQIFYLWYNTIWLKSSLNSVFVWYIMLFYGFQSKLKTIYVIIYYFWNTKERYFRNSFSYPEVRRLNFGGTAFYAHFMTSTKSRPQQRVCVLPTKTNIQTFCKDRCTFREALHSWP